MYSMLMSIVSFLVTSCRKRILAVKSFFPTQVFKLEQLEDFGHSVKAKKQQNVDGDELFKDRKLRTFTVNKVLARGSYVS